MQSKIIVLSGGLDSTTLLYDIVNQYGSETVKALSFDYHQKHSIELDCGKKSCEKLNVERLVIDMGFLGDMVGSVSALINGGNVPMPKIEDVLGDPAPPTEVPFRNMIFLSLAFSYAQAQDANKVYIGIQAQDSYSYFDTSPMFIEAMNNVSKLNRKHNIEAISPYVNLSKSDELDIGYKLNVPYEDTWTCYAGPNERNEACGVCPSCSERIMAFAKYGVVDPIQYAVPVKWEQLIDSVVAL